MRPYRPGGTTLNVAWNTKGHGRPGDAEYLAVWREILIPIGREFGPELVIIAAGFDAAEGDRIEFRHGVGHVYGRVVHAIVPAAVVLAP